MSTPILTGDMLLKRFRGRGLRWWAPLPRPAVSNVSLRVMEGEMLAIVGESGSGKSVLSRMLLGLTPPTSGSISFLGRPVGSLTKKERMEFRRTVQPVFQDPASSLNPRMQVQTTLAHVLLRHKLATRATLTEIIDGLLTAVGLTPPEIFRERYPHQLSGGQQQRVAIARALAVQPRLIIADEPLSSLDMSVQAQVLNLIATLQKTRNLGIVLISHDLNLVEAIADRVMVMYLGEVVEAGNAREVLGNPQHAYTRSLLAAKLSADPRKVRERLAAEAARMATGDTGQVEFSASMKS